MEKPSTERGGKGAKQCARWREQSNAFEGSLGVVPPPVAMEAKTDPDISRMPSQFSTDGCSIEYGTFDKYGFIYVPPCIEEQSKSAPGTGDCAPASQASLLQKSDTSDEIAPPGDAPPGEGEAQKMPITMYCAAATQVSLLQESDASDKIAPPGDGEVQMTPITKYCAAPTHMSLLQESDTYKIAPPGDVPPGESEVQKTPDPGESVGVVIVDKLTKPKLDVDSPEIITGGFCRAKLMDNLSCLVKTNKMSNGMRRKKRKTSGE